MKNLLRSLLFLFATQSVSANPIQATFLGVNGTTAFGYYVGPYYGELDQQFVIWDCVDFANEVSIGQRWTANLSHINTQSDLANTRFGGLPNALQLYQEAAWLTLQYSLNPASQYADIQATIWQLFDRSAPSPSTGYWLSMAQSNYASGIYDHFFVVTNAGQVLPNGQVQELLTLLDPSMPIYPSSSPPLAGSFTETIATPEPPLLAGVGLALLIGAGMVFRRLRYRSP